MTCIRSFFVPDGAREGAFRAKVSQFVGVCPQPGGFAIMTVCDEQPQAGATLIMPNGGTARPPTEGSTNYMAVLRGENESPPAPLPIRNRETKQAGLIQWQIAGTVFASGRPIVAYIAPTPFGNESLGFEPIA